MKFGKRYFVWPFLFRFYNSLSNCGAYKTPMISGDFAIRFFSLRTAGTMRLTDYFCDIRFGNKFYQFNLCWRPDVTHYYWVRQVKIKEQQTKKG